MIYYSIKASINCKFISETHIFRLKKINDYALKFGAINNEIKRPKISLSSTKKCTEPLIILLKSTI